MKKINWLGFLSLLSLIAVLGWHVVPRRAAVCAGPLPQTAKIILPRLLTKL